jgi:anti-sigma B factor antagonist
LRIVKQLRLEEPSRLRWMPEPFSIHVRPARQRVIVAPKGDLDVATVGQLAVAIDELVDAGFDAIVIDLRETSFMDSSGVHALLEQTARADASFTVIDGPRAVRRVIDLCGVRHLLPFDDGR